jgi:hypothetical protein
MNMVLIMVTDHRHTTYTRSYSSLAAFAATFWGLLGYKGESLCKKIA